MRGSCRIQLAFLLCYSSIAFSGWEESAVTLQKNLVDQGFENVQVSGDNNGLVRVRYENRVYRNEVRAAGVVLAEINRCDSTWSESVLLPLHRQVVIAEIGVGMADYRAFRAGSIGANELAARLQFSAGESKSEGFLYTIGPNN